MGAIGASAISIIGGWLAGGKAWGYAAGAIVGGMLFPQRIQSKVRTAEGISVTTPTVGAPLPIIYGRSRVPGNLIWTGDFKQQPQPTGKGGKGGKGVQPGSAMKYTVSFAVALCEGIIAGVPRVWASGELVYPTDPVPSDLPWTFSLFGGRSIEAPEIDMTVYGGTATQPADSYITSLVESDDPGEAGEYEGEYALRYPHVAYVVHRNYDLGSTATIPNMTYEVVRYNMAEQGNPALDPVANPDCAAMLGEGVEWSTDYDMNPAVIVADLLTHPRYGLRFGVDDIDWPSFVTAAQQCADSGIFISPVLDATRDAIDWLEEVLVAVDCMLTYSQGRFRMRAPRVGDAPRDIVAWSRSPNRDVAFWQFGARGSQRAVAVDPTDANNLCAVWTENTANGMRIGYCWSTDGGATWLTLWDTHGVPSYIDDRAHFTGHDQYWPCIAVQADGRFHVTFTASNTTYPATTPQIFHYWWPLIPGLRWDCINWAAGDGRVSDYADARGSCLNYAQRESRIVLHPTTASGAAIGHIVWTGYHWGSRESAYYRSFDWGMLGPTYNAGEWMSFDAYGSFNLRCYHPAIDLAADGTPRAVWCESAQIDFGETPSSGLWWWDGIVEADGLPWTERNIRSAWSGLYWGFITATSRIVYRSRAAGFWGSLETVDWDWTRLGVSRRQYPFASPCMVIEADDEPYVVWQHRPSQVFPISQIYGKKRTTLGTQYLWDGDPTCISDHEYMNQIWNSEPFLALTPAGNRVVYWSGTLPGGESTVDDPYYVRGSWMRVWTAADEAWAKPFYIDVGDDPQLQWAIKSLSPQPSNHGLTGLWVHGLEPNDYRQEGRCWYAYALAPQPSIDPTVPDWLLTREHWVQGGDPSVSRPGTRDALNLVRIAYLDRNAAYAEAVYERGDDWDVARTGARAQTWALPAITTASVAMRVATRAILLARHPLAQVVLTLGPQHFQVTPADLVRVNDDRVELTNWIGRVLSVVEDEEQRLTVRAIEAPLQLLQPFREDTAPRLYPVGSMRFPFGQEVVE